MRFKRICVVGVGGVGGYFGGKMAHCFEHQPKHPRQIYFVARGRHLAHIQQNGLMLNTPSQEGVPTPATAALYADIQKRQMMVAI